MLSWNFLTESVESDALLLDCRSENQYAQSTIRGAYGAAFIKKPYGSGPQSLAKISGYMGFVLNLVEKEKKSGIMVFDEGVGMYASRMAWMLMCAGYAKVVILSKKFEEIPADQLEPGTKQIEAAPADKPIHFAGTVGITFLQQNLTRVQLLDVRTPAEYEGRIPRMVNPEPGSVCGRIPGSLNWDWRQLYGPDGKLKNKGDVISDIRRIGLIQERPTVIYDFNGARSCTTALVLSRCGYRNIQIYTGSWMEWRKSKLPKQNMSVWNG